MKIKGNVGPENELTYDLQPSTSDDSKKYSLKVTATSKITTFSHTFTVFFTYKKVISWTKAQESGINPGREIVQDMRNELRRWINDPNGNNWRLCYSAKRDGYNVEKFHNQCDGRGKIFMQIHRPDNGRYFGAVTDRSWQRNGGYLRQGPYDRDLPFLWTVRPDPGNNDKPRLYFQRKCCVSPPHRPASCLAHCCSAMGRQPWPYLPRLHAPSRRMLWPSTNPSQ